MGQKVPVCGYAGYRMNGICRLLYCMPGKIVQSFRIPNELPERQMLFLAVNEFQNEAFLFFFLSSRLFP